MGTDRVDKALTGQVRGGVQKARFIVRAAASQAAVVCDFKLKTSFSKPQMVLIEPTLRCPMACKFCDLPTDTTYPKRDELPISRWKEILAELREFSPLIRSVYISGGEPFLRHDLIDLIEHAHSIGMGTRTLTIGKFLDEKLCNRLLDSPMEFLKFSLHSNRAEVHDELVGRDIFERATGAMRYLKRNSYEGKLGILCTMFAGNVDHVGDIVRFVIDDIGLDSILFRPLFGQTVANRERDGLPSEYDGFNEDCVIEDVDAVRRAVDVLKDLKREGYPIANSMTQLDALLWQASGSYEGLPGCHMMYESMFIKPNGNIDVCGHLALGVMGNVAERSVGEVLRSAEAYDARHAVSRECRCQGNVFLKKSGGDKLRLALELLGG